MISPNQEDIKPEKKINESEQCKNCISKCKPMQNLDVNIIRNIFSSELEKIKNSEQTKETYKNLDESVMRNIISSELEKIKNSEQTSEISKNLDEKTIRQIFRSEIEQINWKDSVKKNNDSLSILGASLLFTGLVSLSFLAVSLFGFPGFFAAFIFWCIVGLI